MTSIQPDRPHIIVEATYGVPTCDVFARCYYGRHWRSSFGDKDIIPVINPSESGVPLSVKCTALKVYGRAIVLYIQQYGSRYVNCQTGDSSFSTMFQKKWCTNPRPNNIYPRFYHGLKNCGITSEMLKSDDLLKAEIDFSAHNVHSIVQKREIGSFNQSQFFRKIINNSHFVICIENDDPNWREDIARVHKNIDEDVSLLSEFIFQYDCVHIKPETISDLQKVPPAVTTVTYELFCHGNSSPSYVTFLSKMEPSNDREPLLYMDREYLRQQVSTKYPNAQFIDNEQYADNNGLSYIEAELFKKTTTL